MANEAEKRACARHDCRVPIEGKEGTAFGNSQALDISREGAGLLVKEFVQVDTEMAVEIALSPQSDPILAVGQVRWVQQVEGQDAYRIGLSFKEIARESKSRLQKFFK